MDLIKHTSFMQGTRFLVAIVLCAKAVNGGGYITNLRDLCGSAVVSTPAWHAGDPG